jgi:hypothetical protein
MAGRELMPEGLAGVAGGQAEARHLLVVIGQHVYRYQIGAPLSWMKNSG